VTLDIYDILGRKVETLYEGNQQAGEHSVTWQADGFASGVYFYKLAAGGFVLHRQMSLLK
jgi:flagellar hook assembly protein FlgD